MIDLGFVLLCYCVIIIDDLGTIVKRFLCNVNFFFFFFFFSFLISSFLFSFFLLFFIMYTYIWARPSVRVMIHVAHDAQFRAIPPNPLYYITRVSDIYNIVTYQI